MELNWLKIIFLLMTFFIVVVGSLVNFLESHLPLFVSQTFRYGKLSHAGKPTSFLVKSAELPKRWFRHFYLFAAAYTAFTLVIATNLYFYQSSLEPWMLNWLDFMGSSSREANTSAASTYIALLLITLQAWHRFYETWFVSVFSNSRINLSHYVVGYLHYFGAVTAIVVEAPGFVRESDGSASAWFQLSDVSVLDVLGSVMFVWACYNQYASAVTLANLRKNSRGKVVSHGHTIPQGGWFQYVSSPHLLTEVLMYCALTLVLRESRTWPYVLLWVACNQVEVALLTHWWYKDNFKHYPKNRKAIIPFIL